MTTFTTEALSRFDVVAVQNGWLLTVCRGNGYVGEQFVFSSMDDLADWLKVQACKLPEPLQWQK